MNGERSLPSRAARRWQVLPLPRWMAEHKPGWLKGDIVAGVTLAAFAIPVSPAGGLHEFLA